MSPMNLAVIYIELFIASANGKYMYNYVTLVYDEKNLALEIDFHMQAAGNSRNRSNGCPKRFKFLAGQLSRSFAAFDFLISHQRMPKSRI
jgi:hypothetical protein